MRVTLHIARTNERLQDLWVAADRKEEKGRRRLLEAGDENRWRTRHALKIRPRTGIENEFARREGEAKLCGVVTALLLQLALLQLIGLGWRFHEIPEELG